MELERFFESCGACGRRTIHFVIDPPIVRYHCANCGRDNSATWGSHRLTGHKGPAFERRFPPKVKVGTPAPPIAWECLSNFERSSHFSDAALHE